MNKFFNFLGLVKRSGNLIEGWNKCDEQRRRTRLHLFIMSLDLAEGSKKKFIKHCEEKNIPYIEDFSKEELGASIGKEEIKVLAIKDKNMASKLLSLYKEEANM